MEHIKIAVAGPVAGWAQDMIISSDECQTHKWEVIMAEKEDLPRWTDAMVIAVRPEDSVVGIRERAPLDYIGYIFAIIRRNTLGDDAELIDRMKVSIAENYSDLCHEVIVVDFDRTSPLLNRAIIAANAFSELQYAVCMREKPAEWREICRLSEPIIALGYFRHGALDILICKGALPWKQDLPIRVHIDLEAFEEERRLLGGYILSLGGNSDVFLSATAQAAREEGVTL